MYIIIYYIHSLPRVLFAWIFLYSSAILIITGNDWGVGGRAKKVIVYLRLWDNLTQSEKARGWEMTPKLGTAQQGKVCWWQPQRRGWPSWVSTSRSPREDWPERSLPRNENKLTLKNPKQSIWAKHILPCSLQEMVIMVTKSTGNNCRETDFSIAAPSNCSGYCKTYLSVFPALGKTGRITEALSGQENVIWQLFGYWLLCEGRCVVLNWICYFKYFVRLAII